MAITKLVLTKTPYRAFKYLTREKDGADTKRVLYYDTIGIMPGSFDFMYQQFKKVWKRAGKMNWMDKNGAVFGMDGGTAHNLAILTVTSYSDDDFPRQPDGGYTEEQIFEAMEMTRKAHARMGYTQVFLVAQCDGKGGYLHIHGFANMVDPITHKTLRESMINCYRFRTLSDIVLKEHGRIPLDPSKDNKLSQEERKKRDGKIPADAWVFDEVLKNNIYEVLDEGITSRDEFVQKMADREVEVTIEKHENGTEGIKYKMIDESHKSKRSRRRKGSTLGSDFMLGSIDATIEETKLKEVAEVEIFTKEDEKRLRFLQEQRLSVQPGPFQDAIRARYTPEIDELKAKRDRVREAARLEEEPADIPKKTKKPSGKKSTVKEVEEEVTAPKVTRKKEERKGRRPEDEVHEVPTVKPLAETFFSETTRRGYRPDWFEEKEEEKAKSSVETIEPIEEIEIEPEPEKSEVEKRKDAAIARAVAKYESILNSREEFYVPRGSVEEGDNKSIEV